MDNAGAFAFNIGKQVPLHGEQLPDNVNTLATFLIYVAVRVIRQITSWILGILQVDPRNYINGKWCSFVVRPIANGFQTCERNLLRRINYYGGERVNQENGWSNAMGAQNGE